MTKRGKRAAELAAGLLAAVGLAASGTASAAPAEQSPVGGPRAHTHHVHTGNGGCVDLDAVHFEAGPHGLHHGVRQSAADMWHGTCSGLIFPGGPALPTFVPHH